MSAVVIDLAEVRAQRFERACERFRASVEERGLLGIGIFVAAMNAALDITPNLEPDAEMPHTSYAIAYAILERCGYDTEGRLPAPAV